VRFNGGGRFWQRALASASWLAAPAWQHISHLVNGSGGE